MYNDVRKRRFQPLIATLVATALAFPLATMTGAAPASAAEIPPTTTARAAAAAEEPGEFNALVFSKTAGFRHDSIPAGVQAIKDLGAANGFTVDTTEDGASFTDENLAKYDVVIWMSTTGDVLNSDQQAAFERYIQAGGGYAGVHAASDTEYDWPWYNNLVGAYFEGHPEPQNASIIIEDNVHPATAGIGDTWTRYDEWYNFRTNPRNNVHVLMSLDETSYVGGTMSGDHPLAWCQTYDGGRAWYTGAGHTNESYTDPTFLKHLLGGIRTAAGAEDGDCNASKADAYELVTLDDNTGNPMTLAVDADRTVFYVERDGRLQRIDAETHKTTTAMSLPVTLGNEDGLLGFVLDPDFVTNNWAYAYWSPATVDPADGPHNRLSRFTYDRATNTFDVASEKTLLKIPTQRNMCCHAGGDMVFDLDGNIILTTGDNTDPFGSEGFVPIDERPGRSDHDAQGTSANSNDLRGKLIRITPQDDGTYTVPAGNLFEPGTAKTRPEIYAMGFRNPFRIGLDPYTGNVLVGEYGPDSEVVGPNRGPSATTEWNIVSEPGNYGWPYCAGVKCYNDFNFATGTSGAVFDPNNLVNDSPNNTGLVNLPPVIKATVWGQRDASDNPIKKIGENGYTGGPMGGPVYKYDPDLDVETKWPAYWDNKALFGDWNFGNLFAFQLNRDTTDAARNTKVVDAERIFPSIFDPKAGFHRAMDMEFGPDGSLYVIDWGEGFGGDNASSGVYRVDYVQANPSPIARAQADVTDGPDASLTVNFSSAGTRHPAGMPFTVSWDFGDGTPVTTDANPTHTYNGVGTYTATLTAVAEDGRQGIATVKIVVGNAKPKVNIIFPENGGFFEWGDEVAYKVVIDDPDASGPIDCDKVQVLPALGHDSHQHPAKELSGCEGSIPTGRDGGHGITSNIFWVVDVRYADDGGLAGVPLTGYGTNLLTAKHQEAEFFAETGNLNGDGGVLTEATKDTGGGRNLSYVDQGDWWSYDPVNFKGIDGMQARLASPPGAGNGVISLRWNAPDGPEIGTIPFTSTGDWQVYQDFDAQFTNLPTESGKLYFVMMSGAVNVNYYNWIGKGVDANGLPIIDLSVSTDHGDVPLTVDATATATDPEGGTVTLQWQQGIGDAFAPGGETQQFVYTEPGTYMLTVRAKDDTGAYRDVSRQITVADPAANMCLSGRSDNFGGQTLSSTRWNQNVRLNQQARVENGALILPASKTDLYAGGGDASNLILQDLPGGAWQATTKVSLKARDSYQQAGLLVYGDDDNYAKLMMQGRDGTAGGRIIQFIREEAGDPHEGAQSNTNPLGDAFPDTVFLRFASDGTNLTASYSTDGLTYTAMPETKALAGIENPKIGLAAFANASSSAAVINAEFDWFHITPDDTASADVPDDEFDGTSLNACRWQVDNPAPSGFRVADGVLQIDTSPMDIYGAETGATNFVMQKQPSADWTVETKVDATRLDRQFQQGGLIVRADDDNYVKLDIVSRNTAGQTPVRDIELRSEIGGVVQDPQPSLAAPSSGVVWLRLAKVGNVFTGSFSADGQTWTAFTETMENETAASGKVGLYALGNAAQGQVSGTAHFDYFHVLQNVVEPITVSHTLDPEAPTGANGWYNGPVTVTVNTAGGGASTVYREIRVDGGDWAEYTTPSVISTDGQHVVEYRASTVGADPVSGSVEFAIDATAPTSVDTLSGSGANRTLELTAEDALSGVERIEYRVGDGEWTAYSAAIALGTAEQTIVHRAVDNAGNVSAETTVQVPLTLNLAVSFTTKCTGKQLVLQVEVENADTVTTSIDISSPFGSGSLKNVKPGKSATEKLKAGSKSITAGVVQVTANATINGAPTSVTFDAPYQAATCG